MKAAKRFLNSQPVEMNSRITLRVVGLQYGDCLKNLETVAVNDVVQFVKDETNSVDKSAVIVTSLANGNKLGFVSMDFSPVVRSLLSLLEMTSTTYVCTVSDLGNLYCFNIVVKFTHLSSENFDKTIACFKGVSEVVASANVKKAKKNRK